MDATKVAAAASSRDPAVGLAAVASLRGLLESLEELQVTNARATGVVLAADRRCAAGEQAGRPQEVPPVRVLKGAAMFERFTDKARQVVVGAQAEARERSADAIRTEHLLAALSRCRTTWPSPC